MRIAEADVTGVTLVADEFGAASAVGAVVDRFRLPFPVPADLQPLFAERAPVLRRRVGLHEERREHSRWLPRAPALGEDGVLGLVRRREGEDADALPPSSSWAATSLDAGDRQSRRNR